MAENLTGMCFRCEYRSIFLETGSSLRYECQQINKTVESCYQYKPVIPIVLKKEPGDKRPQFAGIISARSHSGGPSDCRLTLDQSKEGSTLYWAPKSLDDMHIKAQDTIWFLECHPALGGSVFGLFQSLQVQIEKVDKRGCIAPHKGLENVYWTRENYKRFTKEFDKEFKEYGPEELKTKDLISIRIPYERVYGEKWTFDHIEYWGELDIYAFLGKDFKNSHDIKKWQRLSGIETGGRSFQEMIVNIGIEFKKIYGNFSGQDFLTPREKKNNKSEKLFFFENIPNTNAGTIIRNPKYIHVESAELNRRWWVWFSKTPRCKKQWGGTARKILTGKENPFK